MSLWIEKYRPTKLDNYVCTEETKDLIRSFLSNNNCPSMLLAGPPGMVRLVLLNY